MSGDDPGVIGITQRELLMEMHDDIRALCSVVDAVARDQALSVERRASMQRGGRHDHRPSAGPWFLARPEGSQRAMQTLRVDGVEELVRALRVA